MPLSILIFHGYLLSGTGSNVYNAELAQALVGLGHEVHLLCQERHPGRHGWIDAAGDWDGGALAIRPPGGGRPRSAGPGRCTVYRPHIGGLLPVYVEDRYEGVAAKAFSLCSEEEVARYLEANVAAVKEVAALAGPDLALANHLVMGPAILARALEDRTPYAVKVHGSALEYTVKRDPERFLPFAREGIAGASGVLVGSRHTAESLWEALGAQWTGEHDVVRRTRLGPPGVDVHSFGPRDRGQACAGLQALVRRLRRADDAQDKRARGWGRVNASAAGSEREGARAEQANAASGDAFARDDARAAAALERLDMELAPTHPSTHPIVVYVGKLIVSKGVDLLLAAWPLVLQRVPDARLAIVGFGALQQSLEELTRDLATGGIDAVRDFANAGRALEGGPRAPLTHLCAFLAGLERDGREAGPRRGDGLRGEDGRDSYLSAAAGLAESVVFTGRLEHEELAELLPACEAIVVPSTFPEAFGMVAVEAAACGLLPISAAHSGLAEVSRALMAVVPEQAAPWLSFPVDDEVVDAIAQRLISWLTAEEGVRAQTREALVSTVRRLWSWEGVARSVISAAEGDIAALPAP